MLYPTEHSLRRNLQSYPDITSHQSLRQLVDGFLLTYKLDGKSPLTIDGHRRKLSRFVRYIETNSFPEVTPMVIRGFLGHIRDKGNLDNATVQRYLITLKLFWKWAIEEGFSEINPTANIRVNGIKQKVIKGLSPDQVRLLINSLNDKTLYDARNKAIVLMLIDCGLRVSEIANLRLDDIDSNMGIITISGKGSKQRLARIGHKTQKALWKYLVLRNSLTNWLWLNRCGDRLTPNGIEQMVRKLGRRLVITLYPHLLRHTFAVSFLRNGASTFECQYALGHNSLEMTRRYCQALGFDDVYKRHQIASPVDNI